MHNQCFSFFFFFKYTQHDKPKINSISVVKILSIFDEIAVGSCLKKTPYLLKIEKEIMHGVV